MVNDTLSDLLTRIRNGCLNNSQVVSIPLTRLSQQVCHTLEKEGFIDSVQRDPSSNDSLIVKLKYKDSHFSHRSSYNLQNVSTSDANSRFASAESSRKNKPIDSSIKNSLDLATKTSGDVQSLSQKRPCITNLKRISKPGLRVYARHKQIPTVLGGLGILILSTPKGIMTDREARFRKVGGEILCSIW